MANLNIRNVPDDVYHRVRLAAAMGGDRVPKGALERFVVQALRRAVEAPRPGAGMPRMKLCASCFRKNEDLAKAVVRSGVVQPNAYETRATVIEAQAPPAPGGENIFGHLLGDEDGAISGLLGNREVDVVHEAPAEDPRSLPAGASASFVGAVEVHERLYVADDDAIYFQPLDRGYAPTLESCDGWSILSAAKDPWHRTMVGYKTKSAPEGPERLFARRGNHMALNLIDVRELGPGNHHYIPEPVVEAAMDFLDERLTAGERVLVHCNDGKSAAPSLAFLYLLDHGLLPHSAPFEAFRLKYPNFLPSAGMAEYIRLKLATR